MREQEHIIYSTELGVAVKSPQLPVWIFIFKYPKTIQSMQVFFGNFLKKHPEPLIGVVAEENIASVCAQLYGKPFNKREIVAYYLKENIKENIKKNIKDNIKSYEPENNVICPLNQPQDIKLIQKWIHDFYVETLNVTPPSFSYETSKQGKQESKKDIPKNSLNTQIYLLKDKNKNETVAMGMLSGVVDHICRINLIYTPPHLRGKGYGKQMVYELASIVQYEKQTPMLYTTSDNLIANKLYQSLGFTKAGQLTEILFH